MKPNKHHHGGGLAPVGPAPQAFIEELLHGEWSVPQVPRLHYAFNVHVAAPLKEQVIRAACSRIVWITNGLVGFVFDEPGRPIEINFVFEPQPPGSWLAASFRTAKGGTATGGTIKLGYLGPGLDSIKLFAHELGHLTLSLGHVRERLHGAGPCVMGDAVMADMAERNWSPWEGDAIRQKLSQPVAAQASRPSTGAQAPIFCGGA